MNKGTNNISRLSHNEWKILPDPPSSFNAESSLSRELLKLNFGQRNELEEEIHGVRCRAATETPELIEKTSKEFDSQLSDFKEKNPDNKLLRNIVRIYKNTDTCTKKSNCYLNDPEVRIRFLRCDLFVVDKAVQRFISFLEVMSELFGDFVAERPVKRSDFTLEEDKVLRKSRQQFLPFRDRSGRRVLVFLGYCNYHIEDPLTKFKIHMYLTWMASRDIETQQKGMVLHAYTFDEGTENYWEKVIRPNLKTKNVMNEQQTHAGLPIRLVSNHMYYRDTPFFRFLATLYVHSISPEQRSITKIYFGEQTEVLYKMGSYGVPVDLVPLSSSGSIKFSNHCSWLDAIEKNTIYSDEAGFGKEAVDCPGVSDVVFRTGTTSRNNPGNKYYRDLIELHGPAFWEGDKSEKYEITMLIINAIAHDRKGSFLEWWGKENTWVVIKDFERVRRKISKALKDCKRFYGKGSRKISRTLDIITSSVSECDTSNTDLNINLQEYYSKGPASKRRKTSDCECFSSAIYNVTGTSEDTGNACFGKTFFPICI